MAFVDHILELLLMTEKWQSCNITSYTKSTKKEGTKTCINRNFVHHLLEILLVAKQTLTFINERWQPYNITSYTKLTKKGTNSKYVQIKTHFCKPCVWAIVDVWTTTYTLSWKMTNPQDNIMNQSNKTRSNSKHCRCYLKYTNGFFNINNDLYYFKKFTQHFF